MPRIAPAVAVVVILVGCIGFNIYRYPVVWEMAAEADRPIRLWLPKELVDARQSEDAEQSEDAGQTLAASQASHTPQASGVMQPASISRPAIAPRLLSLEPAPVDPASPMKAPTTPDATSGSLRRPAGAGAATRPMCAASSAKYGALAGQATPRAETSKRTRPESPKFDEPRSEQQESAESEGLVFQRPLVAVNDGPPTGEAQADDSAAPENRLASRRSRGDRFGISTRVPAGAANAAREARRLTRPISLRDRSAAPSASTGRPTVRRLPPVDQVAPLPEPDDQLPWSGDVIPIYPTTGIE